jgi:hypothetical protein
MSRVEILLAVIAVLLLFILVKASAIASRMRQHFPTEHEEDYDWSQKDPAGHWAAHKDDKR